MSLSDWSIFAALRGAIFVSSAMKSDCSECRRPKWHSFWPSAVASDTVAHSQTHWEEWEDSNNSTTHLVDSKFGLQASVLLGTLASPYCSFLIIRSLHRAPLTVMTGSFLPSSVTEALIWRQWAFRVESLLRTVPKYPITYIYNRWRIHLCVSWQWRSCRARESCAVRDEQDRCVCPPAEQHSLVCMQHLQPCRPTPSTTAGSAPAGQAHYTALLPSIQLRRTARWPHPPPIDILSSSTPFAASTKQDLQHLSSNCQASFACSCH